MLWKQQEPLLLPCTSPSSCLALALALTIDPRHFGNCLLSVQERFTPRGPAKEWSLSCVVDMKALIWLGKSSSKGYPPVQKFDGPFSVGNYKKARVTNLVLLLRDNDDLTLHSVCKLQDEAELAHHESIGPSVVEAILLWVKA